MNLDSTFEVSRRAAEEAGNAVLTGVKTMPGSHMARNSIHPNGERNADFKTFYPSCFSTTEYAECTENREFPEEPFGKFHVFRGLEIPQQRNLGLTRI